LTDDRRRSRRRRRPTIRHVRSGTRTGPDRRRSDPPGRDRSKHRYLPDPTVDRL